MFRAVLLFFVAILVSFTKAGVARVASILCMLLLMIFGRDAGFFYHVFLALSILVLLVSKKTYSDQKSYSLFLSLIASGLGVVLASNLFYVFIFFEVSLICSYFMAFEKDRDSVKAVFKYFVLSSIGSAIILFGLAILYSQTGSFATETLIPSPIVFVMLLIGFCVKIGIFPFHTWLPELYDASGLEIILIFSVILNKIGVVSLARFLPLFAIDWPIIMASLACVSMTAANLIAIAQKNVKKLLAFSSISHMSYVVFGLSFPGSKSGAYFHIINHAVSMLIAFYSVMLVCKKRRSKNINDLKGVLGQNKLLAAVFLVSILSLAGMPFFPTFLSELLILRGAFEANRALSWIFLANLLIGIVYYLNLIVAMLLKKEIRPVKAKIKVGWPTLTILFAVAVFIMLTGFFPNPLIKLTSLKPF